MLYLSSDSDVPILLPSYYHYMLSVYGASRCFSQDEQHYQAQTYMDEFSNLKSILELGIKDGSIVITNNNGEVISDVYEFDYVVDVYFKGSDING